MTLEYSKNQTSIMHTPYIKAASVINGDLLQLSPF